jgi:drug/metabolite transporter (DMT)-like permease
MDRRAWTLTLILAGIWGASYLFIEIGLRDFSPPMVAFLRCLFATAVLVPIAFWQGALAGLGQRWRLIVMLAAVQAAGPFLLIALGQEEITSSLAGILISSAPIFTAILAIWVDREERSTGSRLVGVLVGFAGVVVLLGVDLGGSVAAVLGGLALVMASLGYAIGGFIAKHRFTDLPPLGVVAWVLGASAALLLLPALLSLPASSPGAGPLAAVAVLGVLGTGIAWVFFYELIGRVGPARSFVVTYLAPGFAIAYGVLLLGESLSVATMLGLLLVLSGSWLAAGGRETDDQVPLASSRSAGATW